MMMRKGMWYLNGNNNVQDIVVFSKKQYLCGGINPIR